MLQADTRLSPKPEGVAGKVVDDEVIIINLTNGIYYSMDKIGAFIWSAIEAGDCLGDIAVDIARRHKVTVNETMADIQRIASEFLEEQLVDIREGGGAPRSSGSVEEGDEVYHAPHLTKFEDMADLFALDPPLPELADLPTGKP